ncbi:MAG: hypothetical protein P4L96_14965 [Rhodoferax sp.]|nr:hypothetical protein [Rhodoferax sp.]
MLPGKYGRVEPAGKSADAVRQQSDAELKAGRGGRKCRSVQGHIHRCAHLHYVRAETGVSIRAGGAARQTKLNESEGVHRKASSVPHALGEAIAV